MPSTRLICPYCNAKLRVSSAVDRSMRFKCRTCKNSFTPNYVEFNTGGSSSPAPEVKDQDTISPVPVADAAPAGPPATLPREEPPATTEKSKAFAPFTTAGFTAPSKAVAQKSKVQEHPASSIAADESELEAAEASLEPPTAGIDKPKHKRIRTSEKTPGALRPFELILAGTLMIAVIGGVATVIYFLYSQPIDHPTVDGGGPSADRIPTASDNDFQIAKFSEPPAPPRPARLFGAWELRSDDGRNGRLVFRPDGSMTASSTAGDSPMADYQGAWFVREADGDRYVLEFDKVRGGTTGYRVTIIVNNSDAFTLMDTVRNGLPATDQQRFVRLRPTK